LVPQDHTLQVWFQTQVSSFYILNSAKFGTFAQSHCLGEPKQYALNSFKIKHPTS